MDSTTTITKKQMMLYAILTILLLIGALIWVTIDGGKLLGGIMIMAGLAMILPIVISQDRARKGRQQLKKTGKRIKAPLKLVRSETANGMSQVSYFSLELVDPVDVTTIYKSDPLRGTGESIKAMQEYGLSQTPPQSLEFIVYVDPSNSSRYFVDIPVDIDAVMESRLREIS